MTRALALSLFLALCGCAALASFTHPPALPEDAPLAIAPERGPRDRVEILLDDFGVPHIYGESETDLSYGLGFMHARDRLFQLLVLRHAAQGRLTELFGPSLVETDRQLRLVSFGVEEQVAKMSARDAAIAEAYVAGVNDGSAHAGRSLEMQLLGAGFAPFEVIDVARIARLQAWDLSLNLRSELARARILARLPAGDLRRETLLAAVPDEGVAIVRPEDATPALRNEPPHTPPASQATPTVASAPARAPPAKQREHAAPDPALAALAALFGGPPGRGLSNAWAVHGSRTASGRPLLANDPHLSHRAPSAFYLAHLEHPDFRVAGATLPGLPAVVIGHTHHLAWGMTTSYADTQDLIGIEVDPERETHYRLEGASVPFGLEPQRYLANGQVVLTETFRTTVFGPVLPEGFSHLMEPSATYAVLWTGFDAEAAKDQLSGFWDLARARDLGEVDAALSQIPAPSQSMLLAFADGTIAYRLLGLVPQRTSAAPTDRPRDGRDPSAGWSGYLAPEDKPRLENPASGYLVAANQRVVPEGAPAAEALGGEAAAPYRALRIHARLSALLTAGPASAEDVLAIQQDVLSVQAERLAPVLSLYCPELLEGRSVAQLQAFCEAIEGFDGRYEQSSLGALPFTLLLDALFEEVLSAHLGDDVARQLLQEPFVRMALERAILQEQAGGESPLFDDRRTRAREGLGGFVRRAADGALFELVGTAGGDPRRWRWGAAHTLSFKNPLAGAPALGGLFTTRPREEAGWLHTPRAEGPLPVTQGAALRFLAELDRPVRGRMALDLGQSGHIGHRHAQNQLPLWDAGNPFALATAREEVEARLEGRILLLPREQPAAP